MNLRLTQILLCNAFAIIQVEKSNQLDPLFFVKHVTSFKQKTSSDKTFKKKNKKKGKRKERKKGTHPKSTLFYKSFVFFCFSNESVINVSCHFSVVLDVFF